VQFFLRREGRGIHSICTGVTQLSELCSPCVAQLGELRYSVRELAGAKALRQQ